MNNDKFNEWACSFSGCDGGNIDASIWVSGIEWGFAKDRSYKTDKKEKDERYKQKLKKYYEQELPEEIRKGFYETNEKYPWKEHLTYPFGTIFAKLFTVIKGNAINNYRATENLSGNEVFKLNLYPIAFQNTESSLWLEYGLDKITGFHNKENYKIWCFYNRFPFFYEKVKSSNKSKLIICTGTDYLFDFYCAFIGNKGNATIFDETISVDSQTGKTINKKYYWILDNRNLIVVVPFFTYQYGFNNTLIEELGNNIKKILSENNIVI